MKTVLFPAERGHVTADYCDRCVNAHLLGAQSQPVLQGVLRQADTIKDQEAGAVGGSGARVPRVAARLVADVQAPAHRVVAHRHQLL